VAQLRCYVDNPPLNNPKFHKLFRLSFRLPDEQYSRELVSDTLVRSTKQYQVYFQPYCIEMVRCSWWKSSTMLFLLQEVYVQKQCRNRFVRTTAWSGRLQKQKKRFAKVFCNTAWVGLSCFIFLLLSGKCHRFSELKHFFL
jgi:hypothetical protein